MGGGDAECNLFHTFEISWHHNFAYGFAYGFTLVFGCFSFGCLTLINKQGAIMLQSLHIKTKALMLAGLMGIVMHLATPKP